MTRGQQSSFNSDYFQLEPVAAGVNAAIVVGGSGALGNAAIVDLGDRTLVFDTFYTPQAAQSLRAAAEQLTGRPASYVVNSHRHADHVNGNAVFDAATIFATATTRELIRTLNAEFLATVRAHPEYIQELEANLEREQDPLKRQEQAVMLGDFRALAAAAPGLELRLPDVTFEQRLVFHGSRRRAELLSYGGGHTPSDAFLHLPDDRLALMGDLVTVRSHAAMHQGNPDEWLRILERVEALELATVVPGHGPVGSREDVTAMRRYIAEMLELAAETLRQGKTAEPAAVAMPDRYAGWQFGSGFATNLRFLMERHNERTANPPH